jgi:DNA repair protein RadC
MSPNEIKRLIARPGIAARLAILVAEPPTETVTTPEALYYVVRPHLIGLDHERLIVVALDRRSRVLAVETMTTGSDGFCIVDTRQIFRWALKQGRCGATSIALAHNHPSNDETPSAQDREVTRRVRKAGEILGIGLVDHLVVTDTAYSRVEA